MEILKFKRELYSKVALIKAAYNFTDKAYIHLDADEEYYYVSLKGKKYDQLPSESEFENEMLAQSVRHEIYLQTKNIRELMLARAMATSVITNDYPEDENDLRNPAFDENEILKDWFAEND